MAALADDGIRWAPDISIARKTAAQFNVPLLIHFYGDNCLPCRTLEERVFSQTEVVESLNKYFICVKVNATQNMETAREFQVHSWPTDVFVSPDGKTLYQGVCQQDLRGYLGTLQNVAVMNRDRNIMLAAQQPLASPMEGAYAGGQPYAGQLANAAGQQYSGQPPQSPPTSSQLVSNPAAPGANQFPGQTSGYQVASPEQRPAFGQQPAPQQANQPPLPPQSFAQGPATNQPAANQPTANQPAVNHPAGNGSVANSTAHGMPYSYPPLPQQAPAQTSLSQQADLAPNNLASHPNENFLAGQHNQNAPGLMAPSTRANVATGPIPANSQPQAIAGAVQSFEQQFAPTAQPTSMNTTGQLAARGMPTYVSTGPTTSAGRPGAIESYPGMPAVPGQESANARSPSSFGRTFNPAQPGQGPNTQAPNTQARSAQARNPQGMVNAQLVSNPYYPGAEGAGAAPASVGVAQPSTPAVANVQSPTPPSDSAASPNAIGPSSPPAAQPAEAAEVANSETSASETSTSEVRNSAVKSSEISVSTTRLPEEQDTTTADVAEAPKEQTTLKQPAAASHKVDQEQRPTEQRPTEPRLTSPADQSPEDVDLSPAIEGYCPVALRKKGEWVQGNAANSVMHRGRVYWLSSQAAVAEFMQAPDANSPVLSGFDPLLFLEEGRLVEGDVQHGLHVQETGTFLLFSSAESKKKYWGKFDHYTAALNAVLEKATAH